MRVGLPLLVVLAGARLASAANIQVTSLGDSGAGTLRAALTTAIGNAEADTISFATGGIIALQTPLPILGDPGCGGAPDCLVINGTGAVVLDGSAIPRPDAQGYGIRLTGSGFVIDGLVISGFEHAGVLIDGVGATDNHVTNCFIGTDSTGQSATATTVVGDAGVLIRGGATGNEVAANVISGTTARSTPHAAGVRVTGTNTNGNRIVGNIIGLSAGGGAPIGGTGHAMEIGIWVDGGALSTAIGEPDLGNVIGNQQLAGVLLEGTGTADVMVIANRIGTDASGTVEMANGVSSPTIGGGVVIRDGAQNCRIGEVMQGNVISGNRDCQVRIDGAGPANEVIANTIGAAATTVTSRLLGANGAPLGNVNGVCLEGGAHDNTIGRGIGSFETNRFAYHDPASGTCPPACGAAVLVTGSGTAMNRIGGNIIGFVFDGEELGVGTAPNHYGILITDGAGPNSIGEEPNQITGTARAAIAVVGASTTGNAFMHNWVSGNGVEMTPNVEICLARDLGDCRNHGYAADPTRGNGGILPPRFDAGAFYRSDPGMALITGTVSEPGRVFLFRVPATASNSGFGGTFETVGEVPVTDPPYTFEVPFPMLGGVTECATAIFTADSANGSELAANVRVVGDPGPDDDGGPLGCRPNPLPGGGDPQSNGNTRCTSGFQSVDGVCTRSLGCTGAGAPAGMGAVVVMIWARRRRRT